MSFITTTAPEQATGQVALMYRHLQGRGEKLPNYALVFSHRPELVGHIGSLMKALRGPMPSRLWCLVNLAAARTSHSSYCALAFANKLIGKHFSEAEVLAITTGQGVSPLTAPERTAMKYATKLARDASSVTQGDIEKLREQGFSDAAIFDIAAAAAWRCFFGRVPDALGACPDPSLGQLHPDLLASLLVGRELAQSPVKQDKLQQSFVESSNALQASNVTTE